MADPPLEEIESTLERVVDLDTETAIAELTAARQRLEELRGREETDDQWCDELAAQLDQRIREVRNRDAYSGELGASMNPEDDDAP